MSEQSYSSHRQLVPSYHYFLFALLIVLTIAAVALVVRAYRADEGLLVAWTLMGIVVALHTITFLTRVFALRAQDRAIFVQESFRHYVLTGKPLDARVSVRQAVGLRFASDNEFVELAQRAAETSMTEKEIKQAVQNWRADTYRV